MCTKETAHRKAWCVVNATFNLWSWGPDRFVIGRNRDSQSSDLTHKTCLLPLREHRLPITPLTVWLHEIIVSNWVLRFMGELRAWTSLINLQRLHCWDWKVPRWRMNAFMNLQVQSSKMSVLTRRCQLEKPKSHMSTASVGWNSFLSHHDDWIDASIQWQWNYFVEWNENTNNSETQLLTTALNFWTRF